MTQVFGKDKVYTRTQMQRSLSLQQRSHPGELMHIDCKRMPLLQGESKGNPRGNKYARPQTNGKAEHVIRTIMEMWREKMTFTLRKHRQNELVQFINFYNMSKRHKGLDNKISLEVFHDLFYLE